MKLSDFNHFRTNPNIKFKEETVDGKTFVIISYSICDSKFWKEPLSLETRGITFEKETGKVVSRPFQKFFNLGECFETQPNNLDWNSEYVISVKKDGSMLTAVVVNENVYFKTKKSFYSDVAIQANDVCPYPVYQLSYHLLKLHNCTPIFEFTSPDNKIVLDYGSEPQFTLLAVRHNETGEYLSRKDLEELSEKYDVKLIEKVPSYTYSEIVELMKSERNQEGFVIRFKNGLFVKCKTSWYLQLHRINTEIRERDIAEMVLSETIDDMKSECSIAGKDITPLEIIQDQVISELNSIEQQLKSIIETISDKSDFKSIAIQFKNHPLFALIMSVVRKKEPNIKEFWIKNYLSKYSLRCIFNSNF